MRLRRRARNRGTTVVMALVATSLAAACFGMLVSPSGWGRSGFSPSSTAGSTTSPSLCWNRTA